MNCSIPIPHVREEPSQMYYVRRSDACEWLPHSRPRDAAFASLDIQGSGVSIPYVARLRNAG